MKVLVVGSNGFIGSHSVSFYVAKGHQVFCADVAPSTVSNYTRLNAIHSDFDSLIKKVQPDICINGSGSAHVGFSFDKPDTDFELNVLNVHKILVAIRTHCPACKFVNFSSAAVYGNPEKLPITEDQSKNPVSPYGFHKLQSEYLLKEYHRFFGLSTISMRIFSAFGPGLRKQLFWDIYQKSVGSTAVELFGSGKETRDFIYIEDLMHALDCIVERGLFDGSSYNVACGIQTPVEQAVSIFLNALPEKPGYTFSGKQKIGDPDNWVADISKLKALGFNPQFSLVDGLTRTAHWIHSLSN